jgi:MraZ protein
MYLGFYNSTVTKKYQLSFPARFKELTGEKLLITTWFEKSLLILPYNTGKSMLDKMISDTSSLLPEVRDLERFFYGNAQEVRIGDKNRFYLSQMHREYAQIEKEAIFIGVSERIELWDKNVYENYGKIREVQIRDTAISHYNRIFSFKHK